MYTIYIYIYISYTFCFWTPLVFKIRWSTPARLLKNCIYNFPRNMHFKPIPQNTEKDVRTRGFTPIADTVRANLVCRESICMPTFIVWAHFYSSFSPNNYNILMELMKAGLLNVGHFGFTYEILLLPKASISGIYCNFNTFNIFWLRGLKALAFSVFWRRL